MFYQNRVIYTYFYRDKKVLRKGRGQMETYIFTFLFIIFIFIIIGLIISSKAKKNRKTRKDHAIFIPPTKIGDSDPKHKQDDHDSNDSYGGFGGDSGGDGGGGGD
jgi:hypothetical protein